MYCIINDFNGFNEEEVLRLKNKIFEVLSDDFSNKMFTRYEVQRVLCLDDGIYYRFDGSRLTYAETAEQLENIIYLQ
jgi:hypothetical protein